MTVVTIAEPEAPDASAAVAEPVSIQLSHGPKSPTTINPPASIRPVPDHLPRQKSPENKRFLPGVAYYGYRYYDPATGRWPSRDLIEEYGSLNLYSFAAGDAINNFDLLGLMDYMILWFGDSKAHQLSSSWGINQNSIEGHNLVAEDRQGQAALDFAGAARRLARLFARINRDPGDYEKCEALIVIYWMGHNDAKTKMGNILIQLTQAKADVIANEVYAKWSALASSMVAGFSKGVEEIRMPTLILGLTMSDVRVAPDPWPPQTRPLAHFAKSMRKIGSGFNKSVMAHAIDMAVITPESKFMGVDVSATANWAGDGNHHTDAGYQKIIKQIVDNSKAWLDNINK